MITKEIEQDIISTVIKRHGAGNKIPAEKIFKLKSEYRTRGNFTYCKLTSDDNTIVGVGFSKRNPRDRLITDVGKKIAFSRACKDYIGNILGLPEECICVDYRR